MGTLANDCSLLFPTGSNIAADKNRMSFAIRIAICELEIANVPIPPSCRNMVVGSEEEAKCMQRMHSSSQLWTTFSNSVQTVAIVCEAVRAETERGKQEGASLQIRSID